MKKIILWKLKFLAKLIIKKYNPKIVGITGSVGKTSAKEAVAAVAQKFFRTRSSFKNYNNEFGVPLTIIGAESSGRNPFGWLAIFWRALALILFFDKKYPEVLVLEMGVDRIGDMDYLNEIVKCDIGIVTLVGPAHLENFGSLEKIQKEKAKLVANLKKNGLAVLNFDDQRTREIYDESKVKVLFYGLAQGADIQAENLIYKFEETKNIANLLGLNFKVNYHGSQVPVILPEVIGTAAVYAALAAIGAGIGLGLNLVEIVSALKDFSSPKGRMKLIDGIKGTMIIDDTYNASPQSSLAAINFIKRIETEITFRKVAIFGDMLELGNYSEKGHQEVGQALAEANFDLLITAGERARDIGRGALSAGMAEDKIFSFANNEEAGKFAQNRIKKGDLILIKGSQGARMEKVAKELMAKPLEAEKLLVRQGKEWA